MIHKGSILRHKSGEIGICVDPSYWSEDTFVPEYYGHIPPGIGVITRIKNELFTNYLIKRWEQQDVREIGTTHDMAIKPGDHVFCPDQNRVYTVYGIDHFPGGHDPFDPYRYELPRTILIVDDGKTISPNIVILLYWPDEEKKAGKKKKQSLLQLLFLKKI